MKKPFHILVLAAAVAGPIAAQEPAGPWGPPPAGGGQAAGPQVPCGPHPGGGPGFGPPERVLVEALGLTEAQALKVRQLGETRRTAAEALHRQLAEAEKALDDAARAPSPDAVKVGTAYLKRESLRKQMPTIDEAFRTGVAGLLTPEQAARLDAARTAIAVQSAEALRRAGVL